MQHARLSALDFVVTITLGRAECYDILAVSPRGKVFKFSVKTRLLEKDDSSPCLKKIREIQKKTYLYFRSIE